MKEKISYFTYFLITAKQNFETAVNKNIYNNLFYSFQFELDLLAVPEKSRRKIENLYHRYMHSQASLEDLMEFTKNQLIDNKKKR